VIYSRLVRLAFVVKDFPPFLLPSSTLVRGRRILTVVRQRICVDNARQDDKALWAKGRSEQRKRDAALRYELKMESHKVGWGDPALVYDEQQNLFRFTDGRFAFSREHVDWGH
jgi:hypothetical protein